MFCQKCGKEGTEGTFCVSCGTKIGATGGTCNIQVNNLRENPNIVKTESNGCFEVFEYQKDLSVHPSYASIAWFMQEMNFRKRQVLCSLNGNRIRTQAGAMQWTAGKITMNANMKTGSVVGKILKSAVTGESVSKPIYEGTGYVMLEPTYKYIIIEDLSSWGSGMVLDDGMFLACDANIKEEVVARTNASSAILGGEGLFNLSLSGEGIAVLESSVPREDLIEIVLENDEVRIDGNMAVAWSKSLDFTVEKSTKSLVGSWISGEGFVNVYRGTGKILMAPVADGTLMSSKNQPAETTKSSSGGIVGSVASSLLDL